MSDSPSGSELSVDRRVVLLGAGAVGAAGLLAACSSGSGSSQPSEPVSSMASTEVPAQETAIAAVADVPVGGGLVVEDKMVVLTQPTEGDIKAFTSLCPHQGCTVAEVTATEIVCPCHGSKFSTETGEVLQGPATTGLAPVTVKVQDGEVLSTV